MAQHDYDISNQSGASFRTDLNNALAAVKTQNSGATYVPTPAAYLTWADTNGTGTFKIRKPDNSAWVGVYDLTTGKPISADAWLTGVSGTNAILASAHASIAEYNTGDTYRFLASGTNTTAVTININSIGVKSVKDTHAVSLVSGNIVSGQMITITYDGTDFRVVSVGNLLDAGDIGVVVQAYDADTAKLDVTQTYTAPQRGTLTTITVSGAAITCSLATTNNFKCTPSGTAALTFTNIASGQSGFIWLDNSGGHAITAAAGTIVDSSLLSTISTAGVYILSYFSDGTDVAVVGSGALA